MARKKLGSKKKKKKEGILRDDFIAALRAAALPMSNVPETMYFAFNGDNIMSWNEYGAASIDYNTGVYGAIPRMKLLELLRKQNSNVALEVEQKPKELRVSGANFTSGFTYGDEDTYESIVSKATNALDIDEEFKPLPKDFWQGLFLCQFSISKKSHYGGLTGLLISGKQCLSSDNARISRYTFKKSLGKIKMLIPGDTVHYLTQLKGFTHYALTDNYVHFQTKDGKSGIACCLMGEKFPSVEAPFNHVTEDDPAVELPDFRKMLSRVALITTDEDQFKRSITMTMSKTKLKIRGEKPGTGWVEESMSFKSPIDDKIVMDVNPSFLDEALKRTVTMTCGDGVILFEQESFEFLLALVS
jgi:hypothetical protein